MPVCVRDGEVCPYGYAFNMTGQCELDVAHCEEGYILNETLDMCIPLPGGHAPFVFFFASVLWAVFVL